jgi:hypothetical protein
VLVPGRDLQRRLLARVPEPLRDVACVCAACAAAEPDRARPPASARLIARTDDAQEPPRHDRHRLPGRCAGPGRRVLVASGGLGCEPLSDPDDANYRELATPPTEVKVLVQAVAHPSRVHVDIETDDIDAEVARLEALGARRIAQVKRWWVMEAPTGQRFCVVRPQRPDFAARANVWGRERRPGRLRGGVAGAASAPATTPTRSAPR